MMPAALVKHAAKQAGKSEAEAEDIWKKAKSAIKGPESESYWKQVTAVFKKMMGFGDGNEYQPITENAADDAAIDAQTHPDSDNQPTMAQIQAGNYRKGHCSINGMEIAIENPKGSLRKGVSPDGKAWQSEMNHHYGYIKGTVGNDKDHIDIFLGDSAEDADTVYVVDQLDHNRKFDEHKVLMGFDDERSALAAYLENYEEGWRGAGAITAMPLDEFKSWAYGDDVKGPVADELETTGLILEDDGENMQIGLFDEPPVFEASDDQNIAKRLGIRAAFKIGNKIVPSGVIHNIDALSKNEADNPNTVAGYVDHTGKFYTDSEYEKLIKGGDIQEDSGEGNALVNPSVLAVREAHDIDELTDAFMSAFPEASVSEFNRPDTEYGLQASGTKTRQKLNAAARDIISRVRSPKDLTPEELAIIKQYSGIGGTGAGEKGAVFEFYTPNHVASGVWDALKENGFSKGAVLEPSCGAGVFIGLKPEGALVHGVEIDETAAKVAALANPDATVEQNSFESYCVNTPDDSLDAIVGNIPFANARGSSKQDDPDFKTEKRIDRYFILRSLKKLRPGGLLAVVAPICIVGQRGTAWEKFRIQCSKMGEFLGAHKLPSGTFKKQGTNTVTDVVVFRKHPRDLLAKIHSLKAETLKEANVYWEPFIQGKYWQGEGKKYIMGTYIPKVPGDRFHGEMVKGEFDDATIQKKLAQKFKTRINWEMLETVEPSPMPAMEGDERIMDERTYVLTNGKWEEKVMAKADSENLDPAIYGVSNLEQLKGYLQSPQLSLSLSYAQAAAGLRAFPSDFPEWAADAVKFAKMQEDSQKEHAWRGSMLGVAVGRAKASLIDGDGEEEVEGLRDLIIREIERNGHPSKNTGKLARMGDLAHAYGLYAGSVHEDGTLSDVLKGEVVHAEKALGYEPDDVFSIVSYLLKTKGGSTVDLPDIEALYIGEKKPLDLDKVAAAPGVAIDSDGMITTFEKASTGKVYDKIDALSIALGNPAIPPNLEKNYRDQIDAMKKRAKWTRFEDVSVSMQQKWIPKRLIREFLRNEMGMDANYGYAIDYMKYNPSTGKNDLRSEKFVEDMEAVNPESRWINIKVKSETGFSTQFDHYMNGKKVAGQKVKKEAVEGEPEETEDNKKKYLAMLATIEANFGAWLQRHPESGEIEANYNRLFNGYVAEDYSGEDLENPLVHGVITLHDFQNKAIRQMSDSGSGILGFDVGLGKSFSALGLYAHNLRMGRTKKTAIVVPKSVLSNWYHEAHAFLGDQLMEKTLFIGVRPQTNKDGSFIFEDVLDEHGQPTGRKQVVLEDSNDADEVFNDMWKIPTTDHTLLVMSKEKFGKIPVKKDTMIGYAAKMTARGTISQKDADKSGLSSGKLKHEYEIDEEGNIVYQLDKYGNQVLDDEGNPIPMEKGKKQKKPKGGYATGVNELTQGERFSDEGTKKSKEYPYFEDMGIDSVIADEGHIFKNSFKPDESLQGYANLPVPQQLAQTAIDMSIKAEYLKDNNAGRGVYMLTATPITNSPTEIFNMLNYVMPFEEFEKRGIGTATDFIHQFGNLGSMDKMLVDGEPSNKQGFKGFKNLQELQSLFNQNVIIKDAVDVNLPLPAREDTNEETDMSAAQEAIYDRLRKEARVSLNRKDPIAAAAWAAISEDPPRPLMSVLREMEKVATDPDLYNKEMTFLFKKSDDEKVTELLTKVPKFLEDHIVAPILMTTEGGFQYIKMTPETIQQPLNPKRSIQGDTSVLVVPSVFESNIVTAMQMVGIDVNDTSHPIPPKYAKLIHNVKLEFERGGKQLIFTEEKSQHEKIARILANQIPILRGQIEIINATTAGGDKLQQISDSFNSGKSRIVICNKKAEVGVNLQKGCTAIHHLTFPWTPASIQQRNGRGLRQGNKSGKVHIYYYCALKSFDVYRLDILKSKGKWIGTMSKSDKHIVEVDNVTSKDDYMNMLSADGGVSAMANRDKQLAEKLAADEARTKLIAYDKLKRLHATKDLLNSLPDMQASEAAQLQIEIDDLQQEKEDETEAEQKKRIDASLRQKKNRLEGLEKVYQRKRDDLSDSVKRTSFDLRGLANQGKLPFDATIIDNGSNVLLGKTADDIIKVGDVFQYQEHEGADIKVFRISSINKESESFDIEPIVGAFSGYYRPHVFNPNTMKRATFSDADIESLKIKNKEYDFRALMEMSRDIFEKFKYDIKLEYNTTVLVNKGNGIEFEKIKDTGTIDEGDPRKLLYPDPGNADQKKEVCEYYLSKERNGDMGYSGRQLMETYLGDDYRSIAAQYGKNATQSQVVNFLNEKWQAYDKKGASDPESLYMAWVNASSSHWQGEADTLGDNITEIDEWYNDWHTAIATPLRADRDSYRAEQLRLKNEQAAEEENKKKAAAGWKPITSEIEFRLGELFMQWCEIEGAVYTDHNGEIKPYTYRGISDHSGTKGKLYAAKNDLKANNGAIWAKSGQVPGRSVGYWLIPIDADWNQVLSTIEAATPGTGEYVKKWRR